MKSEDIEVDKIIDKLLEVKGAKPGKQANLTESEIKNLCVKSREIYISQPILLELEAPIKIVGDIHGQYYDFLKVLDIGGSPATNKYLFLGDYVDRGAFSIEVLLLVLAIKINFPDNVLLLRGNHECRQMTSYFNFRAECTQHAM